jgi:uncharacterized DUF497 family protein
VKNFSWHDWNLDKIAKHGVSVEEAERVVRNARRPYPRKIGEGKWLVEGRGQGDRVVKAIYVIDPEETLFIIHAMPLRRG